jgi:hypothetical protein
MDQNLFVLDDSEGYSAGGYASIDSYTQTGPLAASANAREEIGVDDAAAHLVLVLLHNRSHVPVELLESLGHGHTQPLWHSFHQHENDEIIFMLDSFVSFCANDVLSLES